MLIKKMKKEMEKDMDDVKVFAASSSAEQFTKEVMCYRYDELYKEILNRK